MPFYNNVLCVPFLVGLAAAGSEVDGIFLRDMGEMSTFARSSICISALLGFGLSTSAFMLSKLITATSMMVINNVNKFVLILVSEMCIQRSLDWFSTAGCVVAILSGVSYSYFAPNATSIGYCMRTTTGRSTYATLGLLALMSVLAFFHHRL